VLRTVLEDLTLHSELDGYADYARRVRYKLVPSEAYPNHAIVEIVVENESARPGLSAASARAVVSNACRKWASTIKVKRNCRSLTAEVLCTIPIWIARRASAARCIAGS
jgi:hypothetical protein